MKSLCIAPGVLAVALACAGLRAEELPSLTLTQAHETALRNHPRITVAQLHALAARQVERQARSGFYPNLSANAVAVGAANDNTRLAAIGALNNPAIFDRNAEGLVLSQLITDFGRTANASRSAKLQAQAQDSQVEATREQILLEVDGAFYAALEAQSIVRVAERTIATRQTFLDQVSLLATNKMRSELDVSFARVNLDDARLLLSKAQNDLEATFTQLSNLMGSNEPRRYRLVEEAMPSAVSTNIFDLVKQALDSRPDLMRYQQEHGAAVAAARAEKAARYPTVAAVASAGVVPIHDPQLPDNYAAAGVTLTMPLFAGGFYSARQKEAELRAEAADANLRDQENNIVRDVRVAWLNAQNAFERLRITRELLENARQSFELAQARYNAGAFSIVELNQADLGQLTAEIAYSNTQYEYLFQRSSLNYQTGTLR